jgi:hypothetical protein
MADYQCSSKSWRSNTSKLDERSFNGVPICPVSAKETIVAGKKRNKEKTSRPAQQARYYERSAATRHTRVEDDTACQNPTGEIQSKETEETACRIDSSFLSVDERGNIVPKTPEVALVAAQAYLLTTQPATGDPQESTHQAGIKGLRLIGDKLQQGEIP